MGWTSYRATHYKNGKIDRKAECDSALTYTSEFTQQTVIKSSMKGTVYYGAVETIKDGRRDVWCAVFLTSVENNRYFAYKDMDETMHPYYYDCPKGILDLLTPTDYESANAWREKCREKKPKSPLADVKIGESIKWSPMRDGQFRILVKHAPAYQFRTWFWFDPALRTYVKRKYVTDENATPMTV